MVQASEAHRDITHDLTTGREINLIGSPVEDRGHQPIVEVLAKVTTEHDGPTPAQVALAWLLARPGVASLVIGARRTPTHSLR